MDDALSTIRRMGTGLTALSRGELKRRIEAARLLRNVSQERLDELFAADGLGKSAGRIERGDPRIRLQRAHLDAFVRHLRVPEDWFLSEDVDRLIYPEGAPDSVPGRLSGIEEQIRLARAETVARVAEVLRRIDDIEPPSRETRPRRRA